MTIQQPESATIAPPARERSTKLTTFVLEQVSLADLLGAALLASYTDWLETMAEEAAVILSDSHDFDQRRVKALQACAAELKTIDADEIAAEAEQQTHLYCHPEVAP